MLRRLLAPAALALLALPRPADACDYIPQFLAAHPSGGATVPSNAQAFAWAPFMGRAEMVAELHDPRAFAPIPVDVRSLGADVVQLELPPLDPGIDYAAEVRMVGIDEVHRFTFTADGTVDDASLPAPTVQWDAHEGPTNSCESSGFYLDVTIDRVPGALLYEIDELLPNDAVVPVGARFETDEATPTLFLSALVGPGALNGRCFFVAAVDQAGNRSPMTNLHCIDPVPIGDAGVPPLFDGGSGAPDAGGPAPDAGEPAPDAGAEPTANGPGGGLEAGDGGCACDAADAPPGGSVIAIVGLLGLGLWRRRSA